MYERGQRRPRLETRIARVGLVLWLAGLAAAIGAGLLPELLLYYLLPARIALLVSTYFFDYLPHQRPFGRPAREAPHQSAVVLRGGVVIDALLLHQPIYQNDGLASRTLGIAAQARIGRATTNNRRGSAQPQPWGRGTRPRLAAATFA